MELKTNQRIWNNYILERRAEFGAAARANRGKYAGIKIHRVTSEYLVGLVDEQKERDFIATTATKETYGSLFLKTGKEQLYSCRPVCGCTQGQHAGAPLPPGKPAEVTCLACKRLNLP